MASDDELDELVVAWLAYARDKRDADWWAVVKQMDIEFDDPDQTWEIIRRLLGAAESEWEVAMIAAGPLENVLVYHGPTFISRIELEAAKDPKLAGRCQAFG